MVHFLDFSLFIGFTLNIWNNIDLLWFKHELPMLTRASFLRIWGGTMFVRTESHGVWVNFTVLLMIIITLLSSESTCDMCTIDPYWAPYSVVLFTIAIAAFLNMIMLAPHPIPASSWIRFQLSGIFYMLFKR